MRMDVNACDCTRGCTDTRKRESALKVDSGRKIPCLYESENIGHPAFDFVLMTVVSAVHLLTSSILVKFSFMAVCSSQDLILATKCPREQLKALGRNVGEEMCGDEMLTNKCPGPVFKVR